jgi:hydroxymethylpyrimidine/phosphomethylpyrimidine kinase
MSAAPPVVLCIGGHDPSGGAGLQADIEAVRATGAWPCTVVSCLTTQDTCGVRAVIPQPTAQIIAQCRLLLADSPVAACKIGLLGDAESVRALADLLGELPGLPVVLDPVLASGAGDSLAGPDLLAALRRHLLARCTLITPNLPEAQAVTGLSDPSDCAMGLIEQGCAWALVTGTHAPTDEVINRLQGADGTSRHWRWPRLPHSYHGSGCTLASHLAGLIAQGLGAPEAAERAQRYTWSTLQQAFQTGRCQWTPNRGIRPTHDP